MWLKKSRPLLASEIRVLLLGASYSFWEKRSGPNDVIMPDDLWGSVAVEKRNRVVDKTVLYGALQGLIEDGLLCKREITAEVAAVQITEAGRSHYNELLENRRTKQIAYFGAILGLVNLLWTVLSKALFDVK